MHGYDWESKPGSMMRTFHPRRDLRGSEYGDIAYHYIFMPGTKINKAEMTDAEAIELGFQTVPPPEHYTDWELNKLDKLINTVPIKERMLFEKECNDLDFELQNNNSLQLQSNPYFYKQTEEYQTLFNHCSKLGDKALSLLFKKFDCNKHFIYRTLIIDLSKEKYGYILQDIVNEYVCFGQYTENGKFIGFSQKNTIIKYAKRILNEKL